MPVKTTRARRRFASSKAALVHHGRVILSVARVEVFTRLRLHAQALTCDTLLALVPTLAVMFAIFKGFGGLEPLRQKLQGIIVNNVAGSAELQSTLSSYIGTFVDNIQKGELGAISVAILLFSVMSLLGHIEFAFNSIFGAPAPRPIAIRFMTYWTILTLGPILLAASFALTAALQNSTVARLIDAKGIAYSMALSAAPLVATWIAFTTMYLVVPRVQVRLTSAAAAAIIAGSAWNVAKYAYAIYAKNAVTVQNIYGSMATIQLFILWLYVSWMIVLVGAELAQAFETNAAPDEV